MQLRKFIIHCIIFVAGGEDADKNDDNDIQQINQIRCRHVVITI